jgi:hypothetical protein
MSDETPVDPEAAAKQDDLDYAAGYQARVAGTPFEKGTTNAWYRGWSDADRELGQKAILDDAGGS